MATAEDTLDETRRRAREVGEDLRDRVERLEPVARERWDELEPVVRERVEELEPVVRQAELGLWRALRALFAGLAVLPAMLVRALKVLAGAADEATERGQDLGEEAMKRRRRRRGVSMRKRTLIGCIAGSVGIGVAIGWVLGRQRPIDDPDEVPFETRGPLDTGALPEGAPPVE